MHILIADDHQLVGETLQYHLAKRDGWSADVTFTLSETVNACEADANIDLVLLDYHMPSDDGRRLEDVINAARPRPVVIFTGDASAEVAHHARRIGAKGFVPKTMSIAQLIGIAEAISMGLDYFPADLMSEDMLSADAKKKGPISLSDENLKILLMIAKGEPNKIIAAETGLSEHVVKARIRTIFSVLDVSNRVQAALLARELGLHVEGTQGQL